MKHPGILIITLFVLFIVIGIAAIYLFVAEPIGEQLYKQELKIAQHRMEICSGVSGCDKFRCFADTSFNNLERNNYLLAENSCLLKERLE